MWYNGGTELQLPLNFPPNIFTHILLCFVLFDAINSKLLHILGDNILFLEEVQKYCINYLIHFLWMFLVEGAMNIRHDDTTVTAPSSCPPIFNNAQKEISFPESLQLPGPNCFKEVMNILYNDTIVTAPSSCPPILKAHQEKSAFRSLYNYHDPSVSNL